MRLPRPEGLAGINGEYGGIALDAEGRLRVAWSDGAGHFGRGGTGGTWFARWDGR